MCELFNAVAEDALGIKPVVSPEINPVEIVQVEPRVQVWPFTVVAAFARAELGIALALTDSDGVEVGLLTLGTNHVGHDPLGAEKVVTVPEPPPPPVQPEVVNAPPAPFAQIGEVLDGREELVIGPPT
jgi:hypothetical protein